MRAQPALRRRIIVSAPQLTDAPDELDQGGWAGGCKGGQAGQMRFRLEHGIC